MVSAALSSPLHGASPLAGFRTGSGQASLFTQVPQIPYTLPCLFFDTHTHFATNTIHFVTHTVHFATDATRSAVSNRRREIAAPLHVDIFCCQVGTCCHILQYVATCFHMLPHFAMKVDYGKSRHLCDDPACPDPVWKLSSYGQSPY